MKKIPLNTVRRTSKRIAPNFTQVDDEDYEFLMQWKWYAKYNRSGKTFYAIRGVKNDKGNMSHVYMHKVIMKCKEGEFADHIDKCGWNNQKSNLRLCSRSENNTHRKTWGTSKYNGVSWDSETGKWKAQIQKDKKTVRLGRHLNEIDAAKAYDRKAKELHGEFATLNFP